MKLSALMEGLTPNASYAGELTGDDYVLAIDCSKTGNTESVGDYVLVRAHIEDFGAELSAETDDAQYYLEGASSMKKSTARSFKVGGKRLAGDAFQDFVCSHAIKFGKGGAVERDYVYFCILTGKGEKGRVIICVNNDGNAESGAIGEIDVELKCAGTPTEYTYSTTA